MFWFFHLAFYFLRLLLLDYRVVGGLGRLQPGVSKGWGVVLFLLFVCLGFFVCLLFLLFDHLFYFFCLFVSFGCFCFFGGLFASSRPLPPPLCFPERGFPPLLPSPNLTPRFCGWPGWPYHCCARVGTQLCPKLGSPWGNGRGRRLQELCPTASGSNAALGSFIPPRRYNII